MIPSEDPKMLTTPDTPPSPTLPRFSSDSANEPLLSDTAETIIEVDEKAAESETEEKEATFSTSKYKIAFSHFFVSTVSWPGACYVNKS